MKETYTKTEVSSYGNQVLKSFGQVGCGFILIAVAFFVLLINEWSCAEKIEQANLINKNAIDVSSEYVDRSNDSKLIATNGIATTNETLYDGYLPVENALVLSRDVEMYQWIETSKTASRKSINGTKTSKTTYKYKTDWDSKQHDSSRFAHEAGHHNPEFTIVSQRINASTGKLGDYNINELQTSNIKKLRQYPVINNIQGLTLYNSQYYTSQNPNSPRVGDIRITYSYVPSGAPISVIGKQNSDNSISEFIKNKTTCYIQYDGTYTLNGMLEKFKQDNKNTTNILRITGFIFMLVGFAVITAPINTIASIVPILNGFVNLCSIAVVLLLSLAVTLTTIAIAWFAFRPVLSGTLLAVTMAIFIYIKGITKKN